MSSDAGATMCGFCSEGFFLHDSSAPASQENCRACPKNAECGWGTTLQSLVLPRNHWRLSLSAVDIRSFPEIGGVDQSTFVGGAGPHGTGYCVPNAGGPRCEVCLDAHTYYDALQNRCNACPSATTVALICIGAIMAVATLVAVIFGLGRADPRQLPRVLRGAALVVRRLLDRAGGAIVRLGLQGKFKIVVSFLQIWTVRLGIRTPPPSL